jgi:hypothetical protein
MCSGHNLKGADGVVAPRYSASARDELAWKRCWSCEEWLDIDLFTADRTAGDGRRSICRACHRNRQRQSKFGVSLAWVNETLAKQGGRCAICASPSPRGKGWAIDHDHACCPEKATSCGACIRGILCNPCNLALGLMGDNPNALRLAAEYIESHQPERMSIVRGV